MGISVPASTSVEPVSDAVSVVLVVEDETLVRMAAVDIVEGAGFVALEAANADQAIEMLESRNDIRMMFTDIDMPGSMDGLKLAHAVRRRWPPIGIILASGKSKVDAAELPAGARFFSKPYNEAEIGNTLSSLAAV